MAYAVGTSISLMNSLAELEKLVRKAGFQNFMQGVADDRIVTAFSGPEGRQVRLIVPTAEMGDELLVRMRDMARAYGTRMPKSHQDAWEQHRRQVGRALVLTVKAKIECIEAGIETFDDAFMSQLALPDGRTVGEMVRAEMTQIYLGGRSPPAMLPDYSKGPSHA